MIIDTTYLLPLAGIEVDTDLLRASIENRINLDIHEMKISLISLFEIQAKASKLDIPPQRVADAVDAILRNFDVIPFYRGDIIQYAHELKALISDYIDRIIIATAIALNEDLITEDKLIITHRDYLKRKYGLNILTYKDLLT